MRAKLKILIIFSMSFLLMLFYGFTNSEKQKKVLFINSHTFGRVAFSEHVGAIRLALESEGVIIDVEPLKSEDVLDEEYREMLRKQFEYTLNNSGPYDLILADGEQAMDFLLEEKPLLGDTPIVFFDVDSQNKVEDYIEISNVYGVSQSVDFNKNINLIKRLFPGTDTVVCLSDDTIMGREAVKNFYEEGEKFPNLNFKEINLSNVPLDDALVEISSYGKGTVFLAVYLVEEFSSSTFDSYDFERGILSATDRPIFTIYDTNLGDGFIGGYTVSFFNQAEFAGEIALSILSEGFVEGENGETNLFYLQNEVIFDYEALNKYGLSENALPENSILMNKPIDFFEENKSLFLTIISVIIILIMFVMYLWLSINNKKRIEKELNKKSTELIESNENLISANRELNRFIEEIEHKNRKIHELVYVDPLTGNNNREAIFKIIGDWVSREELYCCVAFIDIDNFKFINDSFGHDFGDTVIVETCARIMRIDDKDFEFGRFGGDEFILIKRFDDNEDVGKFLNSIITLFSEPLMVGENSLFVSLSIGASLYPYHGTSEVELIKKADLALYVAKNSGKNRAVIYTDSMSQGIEDKMLFQSKLREGFSDSEFHLVYQPYFSISEQDYVGVEVLLRWHSGDLGYVSPLRLVSEAEEMGLINEIGLWILEESCKFAVKINEKIDRKITISINISSIQLVHPNFIENVEKIIESTGVDPGLLCFEITESVMVKFTEHNMNILSAIRDMGICIAIDDFGTGYSSLGYFKYLPARVLKIDKVFIDWIDKNPIDKMILDLIIKLAHKKGLIVTAEGVEHQEQVEFLSEIGCDLIQGYYYAKAGREEEVLKLFN